MIRVGFIGAGNRVKNFNAPVLGVMEEKYDIIGHVTKTGAPAAGLGKNYSSIEEISADSDLLVVSVPAAQNLDPIKRALQTKKPLLLETPLGVSIRHAQEIYNLVVNAGIKVGVLEQWPFLPFELFKKKIIETGLIGRVIVVENDYRTYEYHGVAQLRSYLNKKSVPIDVKTQKSLLNIHDGRPDAWTITTVKYNDNSLLIYKYSDMYKRVNYRPRKTLRIYGTSGTIYGDCLFNETDFCTVITPDEEYISFCEHNQKEIKSIFFTPRGGNKIEWKNPFAGKELNEHQIAIAYHFEKMYESVTNGVEPLYTIRESLLDTMILS